MDTSVLLALFQKFHRELCLLLMTLFGLACGHLIDTVLLIKLRPQLTVESVAKSATIATSPERAAVDLNLILQNNIFDTDSRSSSATMTLDVPPPQDQESATGASRADLELYGTVVAAENSLVLIKANKKLEIFHLGEQIPGAGSIEEIKRNQVKIRNQDKSLITLTLHEKPTALPGTLSDRTESAQATGGEVKEVGENRWLVSRNLVESVRQNFADQLRLAQMEPHLVGGKTNGFLVKRLNPRSILVKMGLRRGDLVKEVNNIKLDSPEKALQIFQQLREARQIAVAVERNGQPMSFAYEIN